MNAINGTIEDCDKKSNSSNNIENYTTMNTIEKSVSS